MEQTVTTWIDIQQIETQIQIDLDEKVDQDQSEIKINGEKWDRNPIDYHTSQWFDIEFCLKDKAGTVLEEGSQTIKGDQEAPQVILPVQDKLVLYNDQTLSYAFGSEDIASIKILVDKEEIQDEGVIHLTKGNREIEWILQDRAGNESRTILHVEGRDLPTQKQNGKKRIYELREGECLIHNETFVSGNTIELTKGENTIELIHESLDGPLLLDSIEHEPNPLSASIEWKDDQLHIHPDPACQRWFVKIGKQQYENQTTIALPAHKEAQEFKIEIEMIDVDQEAWKQEENLIILPLPTILETPIQNVDSVPKIETPIQVVEPSKEIYGSVLPEKKEPVFLPKPIEEKIQVENEQKIALVLEKKPIALAPKISILNDNLQNIEQENETEKVRIRFDLDQDVQIETIQINTQTIPKEKIRFDQLERPYIEVEELKEANEIQIELLENGERKTLTKTFETKKPSWRSKMKRWFHSIVSWFKRCIK